MKKKLFILVPIGVLLLIQLIRIDTTNPESDESLDFLYMTNAPAEITNIVKQSCYDCHSNDTKYPWYSNVAPVSWLLKSHIEEAREHLNFSEWGDYSMDKQTSLKVEIVEEVEEGEMPLPSYTLLHPDAKLTPSSKQALIDWLKQLE